MGRRSRTVPLLFLFVAIAHAQNVGSAGNTCPDSCPDSVRPVCGTNNVAYRNECHLRRASCQNSAIQKRNDGPCDVSPNNAQPNSGSVQSPSSGNRPSVGDLVIGTPVRPSAPAGTQSSPVINAPQPERNCPDDCSPGFRPVCGTDGQVYANDCKIRVAICKNPNLQKKNDGVCEKDCNIACPVEVNYVCGSDGRTYVNDCELIVARCKDPAVSKARDGACPNFRETDCVAQNCERTLAPVCGSDGRTYENFCQLRNRACVDRSLLRLHDGQCVVQRCGEACPTVFEPVCGSDDVSYQNLCTLVNKSCRDRSNLVKVADGPCRPGA